MSGYDTVLWLISHHVVLKSFQFSFKAEQCATDWMSCFVHKSVCNKKV